MKRSELATMLLLAAGAASGGGAFIAGRLAVASTPPATIGALRYTLALGLFGLLLAAQRKALRRPSASDMLRLAGMGVCVVAGYNLLFLQGLRLAPAADGGLIVPGSAPSFSLLFAWLLLRERPSTRALSGSLIAAVGILVIFAAAGGFAGGSPSRRLGDLCYLAGGSMWGLFNTFARSLHGRVHPIEANTYAVAFGLTFLAPLCVLVDGPRTLATLSPASFAEIGYLAAFATVLLLWANVRGVERLGVARAAPFTYVAPVSAVLGAVLILGENVGWLVVAGGVIALTGTAIATGHWKFGRLLERRLAAGPA